MVWYTSRNASSTPFPVLAEHGIWIAPTERAYSTASASSTCRNLDKSYDT
jgi:hypothetical protein